MTARPPSPRRRDNHPRRSPLARRRPPLPGACRLLADQRLGAPPAAVQMPAVSAPTPEPPAAEARPIMGALAPVEALDLMKGVVGVAEDVAEMSDRMGQMSHHLEEERAKREVSVRERESQPLPPAPSVPNLTVISLPGAGASASTDPGSCLLSRASRHRASTRSAGARRQHRRIERDRRAPGRCASSDAAHHRQRGGQ